ncbi:MAG: TonB family protein [Paludibacteraceae bacterium]|nr:TonB family protein [Paludibacteraceae bacterium]
MEQLLKNITKTLCIIFIQITPTVHAQISKNIRYLETPTVYEGKDITSFKVFQVFDECALARESENKYSDSYYGKTVLILGDLFYDEQIVTIKNPILVGIYKYDTNGGISKTVPVIKQNGTHENKKSSSTISDKVTSQEQKNLNSNNSWSLDGRTIRGTMATPTYKDQEEGTIVVRIMVNENGDVINANIAPGTDITSKHLHNAAINAAKKTKFNAISTKKNQSGTITYNLN